MHWINKGQIRMIASIVFTLALFGGVSSQRQSNCEQSSCYPATGDLLIGREHRLTSTSTCGLERPQRYCIVSHLEDRKKCFFCDSRQPYARGLYDMSHRAENIVSRYRRDWKNSWWQANNGVEDVSIQLKLEAEFHFTHLIMRFKTFRPAAMFIERSYDFGKTWKVYRYFADDCAASYPGIPTGPIRSITDVICVSRYSDVEPSTEGEVVFRVLPPFIQIENPYTEEVQDLLKMTDLRVNFTKLHTLGDNLLDNRDEIKEKYYYAMYDMVVRGSCSCYGHASRCLPLPNEEHKGNVDFMVHGRCECTHNTKGLNCEKCEDFYNDLPWEPAQGREIKACKKCNCNGHATRCHFDAAVFKATGSTTGGVCDECQHNTQGKNCEECKPFFFQDPYRNIRDPSTCQPCDCDPIGSEHGGECESHTDAEAGLEAGKCICKRFVEGRRCDQCRNGYWNMRSDNTDGCEECTCDTLGTVGNYGCDKRNGQCRCKRYVTGAQCNQCLPQYWGLSNAEEGCKTCDCDVGGSVDNNCDQATGQCKCHPNVIGRRCDQPAPGYFVPSLDWLRYEGEFAEGSMNTRVIIREPNPGRETTWTGPGFMRVSEGDSLTFKLINDIPMSMEYDIIIRYEPQMSDRWDDVRVTVVRPNAVDQRGPCANSIPQDDNKATSLPAEGSGGWYERARHSRYLNPEGQFVQLTELADAFPYTGSRYYVVTPSSCLESDVEYEIRLDFTRYKSGISTPQASVLIDSIVLIPNTDSVHMFQGPGPAGLRAKEEYERYRCREQQLGVVRADLPEVCKMFVFSITADMQERALDCMCDLTGSDSSVCNPLGGQCECKANVIGRQCDQCAPATYGFGPAGCSACNCNNIGSRDSFCQPETGQCMCVPNVYGRQCNECQRGFFGFPSCEPCQCNGRATECSDATGSCIMCQDNTGGNSCERCAVGFYGDPRPDSPYGCRACMCPGGADRGPQHGDSCRLDTRTNDVICDCQPGYKGTSCDQCDDNYFGNPTLPGGTCESCTCNGNIDPDVTGSCDPSTGECLMCQYYTEGFSCERCVAGYYGDATQHNCQRCICNILGTDRTAGPCNRETGQCPCLPNVMGTSCDKCIANHWKIASGTGCEGCDCDPTGSVSDQCNEFDGQCRCRPGRGGRDCSECPANYYGDPNVQCLPCNCNGDGSDTLQCNRRTGECECIVGVAGEKCDRCARGTTGELPYCVPCGECFDNWDDIIQDLKDQTNELVKTGGDIKVGGAPGAFDKEFKDMEDKLDAVRKIVDGANVTADDIEDLKAKLGMIRQNLTQNNGNMDGTEDDLRDTNNRIEIANNKIESIKNRVDDLKQAAENLKANATNIRELDVTGAYNSTKESLRRSREAQGKVDDTDDTIGQSEYIRDEIDDLIAREKPAFDQQYQDNEDQLKDLTDEVETLDDKLIDLNEMVCYGRGDPCDSACGGAGCGKCGGVGCLDGAVTKAAKALEFAKDTEAKLKGKADEAREQLDDVSMAQDAADMAKDEAQMAFDRAQTAKNESEDTRAELQELIDRIKEFLTQKGARPADIRAVANEVLAMKISLTPEEIQDLANQINDTIRGLTDIDNILDATRDDLKKANELKDAADQAKKDADDILDTAQRVLDALKKAEEAQEASKIAIDQAEQDMEAAQDDLTQIESEAAAGEDTSNKTLKKVRELNDGLGDVKVKFTENEMAVERATTEADKADTLANAAETDANDLEEKYNDVKEQIEMKHNETDIAKQRAEELKQRAATIYDETYRKVKNLEAIEEKIEEDFSELESIKKEIDQLNKDMEIYTIAISERAQYHRKCAL